MPDEGGPLCGSEKTCFYEVRYSRLNNHNTIGNKTITAVRRPLNDGGAIMKCSSLLILLTLLMATTSAFAVQRTVLAEEFTGTW